MCATPSFVCNAKTCRLDWEREIWHRAGHSILDDAACRISYRKGDIRAARFNLAPNGFLSFNNPPAFCQQMPSSCVWHGCMLRDLLWRLQCSYT